MITDTSAKRAEARLADRVEALIDFHSRPDKVAQFRIRARLARTRSERYGLHARLREIQRES